MDLLTQLQIDIFNFTQGIKWDNAEIPVRSRDATIKNAYHLADLN